MSVVLVTGAGGLVGDEAVRFYCERGWRVIGVENDTRSKLFGTPSPDWYYHPQYTQVVTDIRDYEHVAAIVKENSPDLVIHTAAQPSHDWSAKDPLTDFDINARGTLNVLEACRLHAPEAVFCFTSTNKVTGSCEWVWIDELETRYEVYAAGRPWDGFDEQSSIDQTVHSPFGCSKLAADIYVQEYARYFGMKTGVFRCGCITGPAHAGAELHGFLAFLVQTCLNGEVYNVFGYKGKQVRDNIHAYDLVTAMDAFRNDPKPGEVYNIGGGRERSCSILEALKMVAEIVGKPVLHLIHEKARKGDHQWHISDVSKFRKAYPDWSYKYGLEEIIREIVVAKWEGKR